MDKEAVEIPLITAFLVQKKREVKRAMFNLSLHGLAIDLKFSVVYFLSEFWRYSFMDQTIVAF